MKTDLFNVHSFLLPYPVLDFLWETRLVFLEDAYPTDAPGPCSQFLVESELLICFCYFVCMILVALCSLLCLSVFHVWSLSLDCILLISTRILVPLFTLSTVRSGADNTSHALLRPWSTWSTDPLFYYFHTWLNSPMEWLLEEAISPNHRLTPFPRNALSKFLCQRQSKVSFLFVIHLRDSDVTRRLSH